LSAIEPDLEALGVGLVFVGSGDAASARDFQQSQKMTAPLYIAPDLKVYRALGFKSGLASTFSPAVLAHAARAARGGFWQGATAGAPFQQGGVLLLRENGVPAWVYRSNEAGDHPANAEILAQARALLGNAP
jgi:hypothetical protein